MTEVPRPRSLPAAALRARTLTLLLTLVLVAGGVLSFLQLDVEAYPDISDTQVVVITPQPGYAPEEVEQQVTIPIERALNGVPGVIGRRSRTIFGLSVVELTFADGTGDMAARQVVLEKLRDAELPPGASPQLGPLSSGIGELFRYRLVSETQDELALRELQDWVVAPRLMQAAGVAEVVTFGGEVKQYQVEIDPLALERYHLGLSTVAEAIAGNNENAGGGVLEHGQQGLVVRSVGQLRSARDVQDTVVGANHGVPVFVRDVAHVRVGAAPKTGIFGVDDQQGGVEGIVLMRRWENPSDVLAGVREQIRRLEDGDELGGAHIEALYDRQDLVDKTLATVSRTLLEGIAVVAVVLIVFLASVRAAVLTALTIPLSLLFAFIVMRLAGVPANLLSLGAIDFGIIVDGTLVMVEHVLHAVMVAPRRRGRVGREVFAAAAGQVARPIGFSLAIIVAAYLPLFMLERVERRLFSPMAFTVCAALLGSLLCALTLVPVLASHAFARREVRQARWLVRVQDGYRRLLPRIIGRARWVGGAALVLVVAVIAGVGARLGSEFLPQLDEGVIWIRANLPPGISLAKSAEIASEIRALVRESGEVRRVVSQSGRNDSGTDPFGPNRNEILVDLQPYETWPAGMRKADLVETLRQRLSSAIPGATLNFTQPIIDTSTEMATGSSADLAVIVRGPDLQQLRALGHSIREVVAAIPGAADTAIEQEADQPQLRISLLREELARFGIAVTDVQHLIGMAIGGRPIDVVYEDDRRFPVALRFVAEARDDPESIGRILIATRSGGRVPLAQVATIELRDGASIIARRDNVRQLTVRTNIRGRDQGSFVAQAQAAVQAAIRLPRGYRLEWGGQFENLDRARRRLALILPLTVAIIFGLLYFAFNSVRRALLVFVSVPLSLAGGVVALWLRGMNLSVSAAVGFISLFGVAVMSGVLLVDAIERARTQEPELAVAVSTGAGQQLRPLLLMIVVALLGMVPAAIATGIGSDVQRPLATVLVGGLLSTLLLAPVVVPALYVLIAARPRRMRGGTPVDDDDDDDAPGEGTAG